MANKHLKKTEPVPRKKAEKNAAPKHSAAAVSPKKKTDDKKTAKASSAGRKDTAKVQKTETKETTAVGKSAKKTPKPAPKSPPATDFKAEPTEEELAAKSARLSKKDILGAVITLTAALILFCACLVIWFYRDSFDTDKLVISASSTAVAEEEYIFDSGSGQTFASVGSGLAIATSSGFELLDGTGEAVSSQLLQMETPSIAACGSFAVFYDLGGTNIAVADMNGNVTTMSAEGSIFSVTVSEGGYVAITSECTGYRALVTVYSPSLQPVYEWYSSSAWVISAAVSPDGRKLSVLSYTATGSEVRFFDLSKSDQQAAFSVSDTLLLDVHWFNTSQLCAYSTDQVFFFDDSGQWLDTYSFAGQYLTACTLDGDGFVAFCLSLYRAGTTSTIVSLDASGKVLGTTEIQSEVISLTASGTELLVLCPDEPILYGSALVEKGRLTGLTGFKYALLRNRGEALLITANFAEIYTF